MVKLRSTMNRPGTSSLKRVPGIGGGGGGEGDVREVE